MAVKRNSRSNQKHALKLLILSILIFVSCQVNFDNNKTIVGFDSSAGIDITNQVKWPQNEETTIIPLRSITSTDTIAPTPTQRSLISTLTTSDIGTFYVWNKGSNVDGNSWNTAWNELDQIQWEKINPGDKIIIGGGEYHTSMNVEKSGLPGRPITITTNGDYVVFDGQQPSPPYCGESEYIQKNGSDAINLEGRSFIVVDGQEWRGIVIRNYIRGIMMREGASNIIIRNMEIYDNGWLVNSESYRGPDGPGVELGGSDILFDRVIVHDNGQDAFQAGWGVWNFTLRNSWLYNSREHPTIKGKPFNYCSHSDGLQIYDGGLQGPVVIENTIIGPSFAQGIMINNKAIVNNVFISGTLFVGNANAGIAIQNGGESSNWTLQNVTIVQDAINESWNLKMRGYNHKIRDSIFWGGPWGIGIYNWSEANRNYSWLTQDLYNVTVELDPMFSDSEYNAIQGEGFAAFNFQVKNPAIPPGTGSWITSVEQLLSSGQ